MTGWSQAIFTEFAKAFDQTLHIPSLYKLESYDIYGQLSTFIHRVLIGSSLTTTAIVAPFNSPPEQSAARLSDRNASDLYLPERSLWRPSEHFNVLRRCHHPKYWTRSSLVSNEFRGALVSRLRPANEWWQVCKYLVWQWSNSTVSDCKSKSRMWSSIKYQIYRSLWRHILSQLLTSQWISFSCP